MSKLDILERGTRSASHASSRSFAEMMADRNRQPYFMSMAKVGMAKAIGVLLPKKLSLGQEYTFLTAGNQQLVYANNKDVVKVVFDSLTFDKTKASDITDRYSTTYDAAKEYLGEHVVDTDFDLRRLKCGLFATLALQSRLYPVRQFSGVEDIISFRNDENYMDELRSLHQSLIDLYDKTRLQVDTNSPNNFFLIEQNTQPTITLVDSIIFTPDMQNRLEASGDITKGELTLGQMAVIKSAVSRPDRS